MAREPITDDEIRRMAAERPSIAWLYLAALRGEATARARCAELLDARRKEGQ